MDLIEYRDATGTTFAWLGRQIGVTGRAVDNWARGISRPTWENATALEHLTGGRVKRSQWYPQAPTMMSELELGVRLRSALLEDADKATVDRLMPRILPIISTLYYAAAGNPRGQPLDVTTSPVVTPS